MQYKVYYVKKTIKNKVVMMIVFAALFQLVSFIFSQVLVKIDEDLEKNNELSEKDKEIKRLDYINEIAKLDIPEKYKAELYRTFDYNWIENKSDASRYVQFRTAWLKGDEVTAMKILNRTKLDDKVKAEMLRDIEVFKTIKGQTGYTSSSQVTDVITSQFLQTTDNAFRGKELNRKKNLSSDRASVHFTAAVLERVKQGESFSEALKAEDALLYEGIKFLLITRVVIFEVIPSSTLSIWESNLLYFNLPPKEFISGDSA